MRTGLDHLPAHKREQIDAIAALVQASAPIEMLILFGSYARGDWVEDLPNRYFSDYDLMAVVATEAQAQDNALWGQIADAVRPVAGRIPVTLIVHDIKELNQEIRSGQYFFADVVREGIVLYDSRRFSLAKPRAHTPAERLELAERNLGYWFSSASEFWRGAGYYAARGLGPHAAFSLHQAAERYFHAALLVYTGYKPKTHDLALLAAQATALHPALADALPRVDPEDHRLFMLLKRAYIEARYSKSYRVTPDELSTLRERVLDLARLVLTACAEKLATFNGPDVVGELPAVPSLDDVIELPEPPPLDDARAVERWRDAVVRMSYERGERLRQEGEVAGQRRERARAIVDVLRRRGVAVSDEEAATILACRDEPTLERWWEAAWTAKETADVLR